MRSHMFFQSDQFFLMFIHLWLLFLMALAINYVVFIIFSIIYRSFKNTSILRKILLIVKPLLLSFLLPVIFITIIISHFFLGNFIHYNGYGTFYQIPMPNGYHIYYSTAEIGPKFVLARLRNKHGEDLDFLFNKVVKDNKLLYLICRDDKEVLRINLEDGEKNLFGKDTLNKIGKEPVHIFKLYDNYWGNYNPVYQAIGIATYLLILFGAIVLGILLIRRITKKEATTNRKQTTEST